MQKTMPAAQKRPPVCESTVAKEAWLLFDSASTVRSKKAVADKVNQRIENRLAAARERYDTEKKKGDPDSPKVQEFKSKLDFLTELYDFINVQANAFISINSTINDQKKQLRTALENKINAPAWVKFFDKVAPWLYAGGAGATVGLTIWNTFTTWLESKIPNAPAGLVKDVANFVGLAIVGVASYLLARVPGWRASKLEAKYNKKIQAVNENEGIIRTEITDLVQLEYRRLAKEYDFAAPLPQEEDSRNALAIVENVKNRFGFTLPLPPSDGLVK